jgi:ubiquitin C-terminal hydrolase
MVNSSSHKNVSSSEGMYSLIALHVPHKKEYPDLVNRPDPENIPIEEMTVLYQRHKKQILADSASSHSQYLQGLQRCMDDLELPAYFRTPVDNAGTVSADHTNFDSGVGSSSFAKGDRFDPDRMTYDTSEVFCNESDDETLHPNVIGDPDLEVSKVSSGKVALDLDQQRAINVFKGYCFQLQTFHNSEFEKKKLKHTTTLRSDPVLPPATCPLPPHIFLTGPAGTGKSVCVREIVKVVRRYAENVSSFKPIKQGGVCITASTGVAAQSFTNGQTTHSALKMKPDNRSIVNMDVLVDKLTGKALASQRDALQGVVLLIIDECSMTSPVFLYRMHLRLNTIFGLQNEPSTYFGGLAILLVGDFYQLKPVLGRYLFQDLDNCSVNLFRLLFHPIFLTTIHRQKEDIPFLELLSRIRIGTQTEDDFASLSTLHVSLNIRRYESFFRDQLHLFTTRVQAHLHNIGCVPYDKIPVYLCRATDYFYVSGSGSKPMRGPHHDTPNLHNPLATKALGIHVDKCSGLGQFSVFWVGAKVMLLKNVDTKDKLVNGSTGIVIDILWAKPLVAEVHGHANDANSIVPGPTVLLLSDAERQLALDWWYNGASTSKLTLPSNVHLVGLPYAIIVKFENVECGLNRQQDFITNSTGVVGRGVEIYPFLVDCYRDHDNKPVEEDEEEEGNVIRESLNVFPNKLKKGKRSSSKASLKTKKIKSQHLVRLAMPFNLAYGCTIHKAQGSTTIRISVAIDNKNPGAKYGSAYVALSRSINFRGLNIMYLDRKGFAVSPDVKAEYARLTTLDQAGTIVNPLGNAVIEVTEAEKSARQRKINMLNLEKDAEAFAKKVDKEGQAARDHRLRNVLGETSKARRNRLRREKEKLSKGETDDDVAFAAIAATAAEAAAVAAVAATAAALAAAAGPATDRVTGQIGPATRRSLLNLGSTCYVNAVLQCLFNCVPDPVLPQHHPIPAMVQDPLVQTIVSKFLRLSSETRGYVRGGNRAYDREQYGVLVDHGMFPLDVQQDVHEYFLALINSCSGPPQHPLFECFKFTLASRVECGPQCSTRANGNLGVIIHHSANVASVCLELPIGRHFNVEAMLSQYFQLESIDDYRCSVNNQPSPGSHKRLSWITHPEVLVLQLKRFIFDRHGQASSKDMSQIDLNLVVHPDCNDRTITYELSGIVEHHGISLRGGHYVAYTKDTQAAGPGITSWYYYNDNVTTKQRYDCSKFLTESPHAYLLFYVRRP